MSISHVLHTAAGQPTFDGDTAGTCRICGSDGTGLDFQSWVRKTFTDHDLLVPGDIICHACQLLFDERNEALARCVDKEKPQRMRNYSHFVVDGRWIPLSKGNKGAMADLLLSESFPEMAVVSQSGQKHLLFRAAVNPRGASAGYVQFEEQQVYVQPNELLELLQIVETLYDTFSKTEIETGNYSQHRIRDFGLSQWYTLESRIYRQRGTLLFELALFLAQKETPHGRFGGPYGGTSTDSRRPSHADMARDTERLQESVSDEHMGTVRGPDTERGVHEQPREVRQQSLF